MILEVFVDEDGTMTRTGTTSRASETVDRLVWVVARLREHCPWTRRLTHDALTEYLVEEAYEAVEVIESGLTGAWGAEVVADGNLERLRLELGDVLFQVVLHAAIATDAGGFDLDGTAEAITAKMIRRNPHVFHPDGTLRDPQDLAAATIADIERNWERIKRTEREAAGSAGPSPDGTTPAPAGPGSGVAAAFADLPAALPALAAAAKVVDRAARQPVDPLRIRAAAVGTGTGPPGGRGRTRCRAVPDRPARPGLPAWTPSAPCAATWPPCAPTWPPVVTAAPGPDRAVRLNPRCTPGTTCLQRRPHMALIDAIHAREILDSRGNPTVEVEVLLTTARRSRRRALAAPPPAQFEAVELRDGDKDRYLGKGVAQGRRAPSTTKIADELVGFDATTSASSTSLMIDLDGTDNKGEPRRQRHPRRLAGRGQGRRRVRRPAAVPLPRRAERPPAAGADDEHPQRRRARRHQRRHPGVHDRPDRRAEPSPRRCAGAPRSTTPSRRC